MKVLAFDQSTVKTGWAVFEDGCFVESGVFDVHKEKNVDQRSQQKLVEVWVGQKIKIFPRPLSG